MNGIIDFISDNWYELCSVIAQFSIVAVLLWYGRIGLKLRPASEEQPEPAERNRKPATASAPAAQTEPEKDGEPYEIPAYAAARQQEPHPAHKSNGFSAFALASDREMEREAPSEFPASTRVSLEEMEQTARRYEIPPVFAAPDRVAAGHGGVGRMLSPLPEADAAEGGPVEQPRVRRTGILRATIKWLKGPMHAPRRVSRPVATH